MVLYDNVLFMNFRINILENENRKFQTNKECKVKEQTTRFRKGGMGVPGFFGWVKRTYPKCVKPFVEGSNQPKDKKKARRRNYQETQNDTSENAHIEEQQYEEEEDDANP